MNANFFKEATVQHGHDAATAIVFPNPGGLLKATRRRRTGHFSLESFKLDNNTVPQGFEPETGDVFLGFDVGHYD